MTTTLRIFMTGIALLMMHSQALANICFELPSFPTGNYQFDDSIAVESYDGTPIAANLFTPTSEPPEAGFPAIIFVNSWVLDEHQYLLQARQFAEKGYLVLSYSARGWGCSGGKVNVTGDKDIQDLTAVVDWLEAYTHIDSANIGISGISYGSGISLMGLAKEPRIKTAVAMSTWASLTDSLYQHQTPRMFWGFFLVSSGLLTANMDPVIAENYSNLIFHNRIPETLEWAEQRSVKNWINLINERGAPVYLANNFGDNLFQPNNLLKFYQSLTVPKKLDLNQGTHASAEGFGLVGLNNYTWNNTHRWFDYWLKNKDTGINEQPYVSMDVAGSTPREHFSNWPISDEFTKTYFLQARGLFSNGKLRQSPYQPWWPKSNRIYSGLDTFATTGIPVLSEILDAHVNVPVKTPINLISRINGIVFKSSTLDEALKIRGIPKLELFVKPNLAQMQLNAYLYDVDRHGVGTLITHGPVTKYDTSAGERIKLQWEMVATAYDVPRGHKLAIAFDTFDALYAVPTILPYSISFEFRDGLDSTLNLPLVP